MWSIHSVLSPIHAVRDNMEFRHEKRSAIFSSLFSLLSFSLLSFLFSRLHLPLLSLFLLSFSLFSFRPFCLQLKLLLRTSTFGVTNCSRSSLHKSSIGALSPCSFRGLSSSVCSSLIFFLILTLLILFLFCFLIGRFIPAIWPLDIFSISSLPISFSSSLSFCVCVCFSFPLSVCAQRSMEASRMSARRSGRAGPGQLATWTLPNCASRSRSACSFLRSLSCRRLMVISLITPFLRSFFVARWFFIVIMLLDNPPQALVFCLLCFLIRCLVCCCLYFHSHQTFMEALGKGLEVHGKLCNEEQKGFQTEAESKFQELDAELRQLYNGMKKKEQEGEVDDEWMNEWMKNYDGGEEEEVPARWLALSVSFCLSFSCSLLISRTCWSEAPFPISWPHTEPLCNISSTRALCTRGGQFVQVSVRRRAAIGLRERSGREIGWGLW